MKEEDSAFFSFWFGSVKQGNIQIKTNRSNKERPPMHQPVKSFNNSKDPWEPGWNPAQLLPYYLHHIKHDDTNGIDKAVLLEAITPQTAFQWSQ